MALLSGEFWPDPWKTLNQLKRAQEQHRTDITRLWKRIPEIAQGAPTYIDQGSASSVSSFSSGSGNSSATSSSSTSGSSGSSSSATSQSSTSSASSSSAAGSSGGSGTCFAADTLVLLPTGLYCPIALFQVGDPVASFEGLGSLEADTVTHVYRHEPRPTLNIDGILVTPEHRFLLPDGGWIRAGEFRVGDAWVKLDGTTDYIGSINAGPVVPVFNIEVARNKTYVAGGIRVHNPKGGGSSSHSSSSSSSSSS